MTDVADIRVSGLDFRYGDGFRLAVEELSIPAGEALAVVGPSGSGKTTLLNLIAGVMLPDTGAIRTCGRDVCALDDRARRTFRITHIGLVFQEFELLEYLSVLDNILLPYRIHPSMKLDPRVRERAAELADGVGIADKLGRYPDSLSQGEKQRAAVCRALLPEPRLLLADEPTGNLDPDNKLRVLDLLLECAAATGATFVTVTHDHGLLDRFGRTLEIDCINEALK